MILCRAARRPIPRPAETILTLSPIVTMTKKSGSPPSPPTVRHSLLPASQALVTLRNHLPPRPPGPLCPAAILIGDARPFLRAEAASGSVPGHREYGTHVRHQQANCNDLAVRRPIRVRCNPGRNTLNHNATMAIDASVLARSWAVSDNSGTTTRRSPTNKAPRPEPDNENRRNRGSACVSAIPKRPNATTARHSSTEGNVLIAWPPRAATRPRCARRVRRRCGSLLPSTSAAIHLQLAVADVAGHP